MEDAQGQPFQVTQWADLPKDPLLRIICYVDRKVDLPRIRGVCKSWRTALCLKDIPKDPICGPRIEVPCLASLNDKSLFLLVNRFYFISPLLSSVSAGASNRDRDGWIARMCETEKNKWHLLNPLKSNYYFVKDNIDYFYTEPPITGVINLLDCQVFELARSMSLVYHSQNKKRSLFHGLYYSNSISISKKVASSWDFTSSYPFAALVLLQQKGIERLLLWRSGDKHWSEVVDITVSRIIDIAFHNGKFYIVVEISSSHWGVRVLNPWKAISLSAPYTEGLEFPVLCQNGHMSVVDQYSCTAFGGFYLLPSKSKSCLYLVRDVSLFGGSYMSVYLLKEGDVSKWDQVEDLGDEIFFVGFNVAFALPSSAQNQALWKPNSICSFLTGGNIRCHKHSPEVKLPNGARYLYHVKYPCYKNYFSLFTLEENERGGLLLMEMPKEDVELYAGLFFPPPAWVNWHCPSLGDVEVSLDDLGFADTDDDDDDC